MNRSKGAQWTYEQQESCSSWINCLDGAASMVDQEEKFDPNAATPTYSSDLFSITQTDTDDTFTGLVVAIFISSIAALNVNYANNNPN